MNHSAQITSVEASERSYLLNLDPSLFGQKGSRAEDLWTETTCVKEDFLLT